MTLAIDPYVPDEDLRICFCCATVNPFKRFIYMGKKQKPRLDRTPSYMQLIKRLFCMRQSDAEPHPTRVYPYLNSKN